MISRQLDGLVQKRNVVGAVAFVLLASMAMISCRAKPTPTAETIAALPTPTLNALLTSPRELRPTQSANLQPNVAELLSKDGQVRVVATPTIRPIEETNDQINLIALGASSGQPQTENFVEIPVYDDQLNANWSLINSSGVEYDPNSTSRWFDELDPSGTVDSGAMSIALEPIVDYGLLFFTVKPDSSEIYHRDEIVGISFWLYSGTNIVDTGDFVVTVLGSNAQYYWSPNDGSVFFDSGDSFSETRFYDLEINRAIPPDSWVKVEVWLDQLLYDPTYEYITGIYIKNDIGFRNRVFVDQLNLIKFRGA